MSLSRRSLQEDFGPLWLRVLTHPGWFCSVCRVFGRKAKLPPLLLLWLCLPGHLPQPQPKNRMEKTQLRVIQLLAEGKGQFPAITATHQAVWVAKADKESPAEVGAVPKPTLLRLERLQGTRRQQEMKGTGCARLQIGGVDREQTPGSFGRKGSCNPSAAPQRAANFCSKRCLQPAERDRIVPNNQGAVRKFPFLCPFGRTSARTLLVEEELLHRPGS